MIEWSRLASQCRFVRRESVERLFQWRSIQIFPALSPSPGFHFGDARMDIVSPLQTFCCIVPVDRRVEVRPLQRGVVLKYICKRLPDSTPLVDLVRAERNEGGKVRVGSAASESFRPQRRTFTDFPITAADRDLSPRDQRGFGFFAHDFRSTGIRHEGFPRSCKIQMSSGPLDGGNSLPSNLTVWLPH